MRRRPLLAIVLAVTAGLPLASCATAVPASSSPDRAALGDVSPGLPDGEVVGQGVVLGDDSAAQLCLGPVAESAPPQCSGIPLKNWRWDGVEGSTTVGDTTWGAYAVQGTFDGETFTVTQPPIMLALYDPMVAADPTDGQAGEGTEAELLAIQEELPARLGDAYLSSMPQDGWLWVDVLWDDGTWQDAADGEFGARTVIIRSAQGIRESGTQGLKE